MLQTRYRLFRALSLAAAGLVLPGVTLAGTSHAYLSWQNKTPQSEAPLPTNETQPTVQVGGQNYPVPPSPYGQVGDPFAHALNWPTKAATAPTHQASVQTFVSVPSPPAREAALASISVPVPMSRPAPVAVVALPAPSKQIPIAKAAPSAPSAGYQVPATSKYAARLNALRAAADSQTATPPGTSEPLAAQETDHVFIPGEHYTDASNEPRLYSLHRQYGLKPDPITVDHDASGALLSPGNETGHFDTQSDQDGEGDAADKDDMKKDASETQTQTTKP